MATTSTIGSSGRNYSTIQAWHDAFTTGGWIGECYNDSEFTTTATITLTGKTTTASNFITLQCASGQSFKDNANVQTNSLTYNSSNGVGVRKTNSGVDVLDISEDYVTISNIQFALGNTGTRVIGNSSTSTTHSILEGCIFQGLGTEVVQFRAGLVRNCLLIQTQTGAGNGLNFSYPAGTPTAANLTIVRPSDVTAGGNGFNSAGGAWKATNCAIFGFTNSSSGGTPSGSNNCSDKTISFGTNNQASKTYANQFVNTTNASQDFRAKTGADLLDNGVTDTTDIPAAVDIVGTSRPQGSAWDIGVWELIPAVSYIPYNPWPQTAPILAQ